ncbi:hypothetical protein SAMN05444392_101192 [Seinonella peptonophila]|uniref:Uncharacterized protein n=1 Tax=Seinonella peptonophila TaxID=112248 RepID=A0A1M4SXG2_9BACL|nr:hypothetical protein [Seinonella peptonophila]SHE36914.1 hypothetical protein SAMN05444392_101192 [Seinonella peptonophila]
MKKKKYALAFFLAAMDKGFRERIFLELFYGNVNFLSYEKDDLERKGLLHRTVTRRFYQVLRKEAESNDSNSFPIINEQLCVANYESKLDH